jgi:thioredoxin reductase
MAENLDLAIIGGGAAGLAAAIAATTAGIKDVCIFEREAWLGGILPQCIHTGFGLQYFNENLTGPEYITRFIEQVHQLQITHRLNTLVTHISPSKAITYVNSLEGVSHLQADAIVLAMGCRERPRGAINIPGDRPAGILTAGTAQRLLDIDGYLPGRRIVILGSGDVGLIMARRFTMEGATVKAVIEQLPYPGGLRRNIVQCLHDFHIPLLLNHTITAIHGADRVEHVDIVQLDSHSHPIPNTQRTLTCDTLILSVGLIPENELSHSIKLQMSRNTGGPRVNEQLETSKQGVFACGNVVHVTDLVDHVTRSGQKAGISAAQFIHNQHPSPTHHIHLTPNSNIRYLVPHLINYHKPFTMYLRVRHPLRQATIALGNQVLGYHQRVTPSELITLHVDPAKIIKANSIEASITGIPDLR